MEFDTISQCFDGIDLLSSSEADVTFSGDFNNSFSEEIQPTFLEAKIVYLLLPKSIALSRSARLQWLLDHLNTTVTVPDHTVNELSDSLEVISAIPREQNNITKCNHFLITYRTEVIFIAQSYKFVYCLDMSPSHSNVDIQKGEVLFDEVLSTFKSSIQGLSKPFTVPGSSFIFQPCIYITIMINTPFFISPAQQVIVKGVQLMPSNLNEIIKSVETHFHLLEGKIADVSAMALDYIDIQNASSEGMVGNLFELPESRKTASKIPMVTPDANFVNMLRYSMLAISLLPEISLSHILVITDGIVAMPDSNIMETLLFQLHYDAISISFLKVGSSFHPHSSAGFVSYTDLLYFFAQSTLGSCLENIQYTVNEVCKSLNIYHELFLLWSFRSNSKTAFARSYDNAAWTSSNDSFYTHKLPTLLSKRQTDDNTTASISLLLSRRLREGFTVDNVFYMNGNLEVTLILQWKSAIYIHYKISSRWPLVKNLTHYEVFVSAPYEFLHDTTCLVKKDPKSVFRQAIIERFWMRLSQLSTGDLKLAQQLSIYQFSKEWYTLPESVKSGIPVFTPNNLTFSDNSKLILSPRDVSCLKFVNIWEPIAQLETNNWRKWFHTHKISLILKHDNPLPKHLHIANSSQRFQVVQCRQAVTALYGMLAEWSSFILIDNHTYVKLLYKELDKPPLGFCMVRVSSKFPCAVITIAFSTKTPGVTRQELCDDLKRELCLLSYLPSSQKIKENHCCVLLQKPLEKILIRYERIPINYTTVIFPDGTQPPQNAMLLPSPVTSSLFTTLSRYLFHKRWIYSATHHSSPRLPDLAISRILSTLTRMRIKEGFSFAHSSSGIVTMVLELWMDPQASCLIQYVLFPPHCAWWGDDILSGSEEENEQTSDTDGEMQMVTEVWIEPQYGKVVPSNTRISYLDNKTYYELADEISKVDQSCINTLLTMEHLSLLCQNKNTTNINANVINQFYMNSSSKRFSFKTYKSNSTEQPFPVEDGSPWYPIVTPRIAHIPFKFDPISILPLCQQTELLFSMFIEGKKNQPDYSLEKANCLLLENILEHMALLHDDEFELSKGDSDGLIQQVLLRHQNKSPRLCPLVENCSKSCSDSENTASPWRCFVKGISITHVILTFVPASIDDLKLLIGSDHTNIPSLNESVDSFERPSSRGSNFSDVPINTTNSICLPIYVFDCPLGRLVNAYVNNSDEKPSVCDDIYEDHRFKHIQTSFVREEFINLKTDDCLSDILGDMKNDEPDSPEHTNVKEHCKTLVLTHSKCFTLSLFIALHKGMYVHNSDVQSAMDQCEEEVSEIDITDFILNVCAHARQCVDDRIPLEKLHQAYPCSELKSYHMLIKKRFFKLIGMSFNPIPTNSEFYFYKNLGNIKPEEATQDSDDEISDTEFIQVEKDLSIYSEGPHLLQRLQSGISDILKMSDASPLFLHLVCTLKYSHGDITSTSVRVLPTCLGELIQNIENSTESLDKSKIQITLDILCLTLPAEVQNILTDYSTQALRTTSFCSNGFQRSISTVSDASANSEFSQQPVQYLSESQKRSIDILCEEVKWLLKDEISTTMLDSDPVESETLNFVIKHVIDGHSGRSSCILDKINLNFVYASSQSYEKFVDEFSKISLPSCFKLCNEGDLYYVAKDKENLFLVDHNTGYMNSINNGEFPLNIVDLFIASDRHGNEDDKNSPPSSISSENVSAACSDGGYDEDISEDYEDYDWLQNLNNKHPVLPNFWLIMKVDQGAVSIYFHCRFLELEAVHVRLYLEVQKAVCEAVRLLCKKVNQLLLLQSLYETKLCDVLLESDDTLNDTPLSRNTSYTRLKNMEETTDEPEVVPYSASVSEASLYFKPGYFSCPVVWETHFILHPRLKTGPGKPGISRGIMALKTILDKFSVSNRNNMFVYCDNRANVFYLRLHENVQLSTNKSQSGRSGECESSNISRSPSIVSLPLGNNKSILTQSEHSITSVISSEALRPRVRSFGEKESKDVPNEDTLILRVHGINDAGPDVQQDLVQVLQNRLDDAVLEFLSVMLARNSMCPLTPEDVHFIQKPFRLPERTIKLTVQDFALQWLESFTHYLKQNLLQFLNIPKYTDNRSHYHFKDYSESDESNAIVGSDNIFIYNQGANPSSGNRGIVCIALAIIFNNNENNSNANVNLELEKRFLSIFETKEYAQSVTCEITDDSPSSYLEFRIWKQGRVNIESLSEKLKLAVCQATWDIITEYYLLKKPLCEKVPMENLSNTHKKIEIETLHCDLSKEIEFSCELDLRTEKRISEAVVNLVKKKIDAHFYPGRKFNRRVVHHSYATRKITFDNVDKEKSKPKSNNSHAPYDDGVLSTVYSKFLPSWLEFGFELTNASVKKTKIALLSRHLPHIVVKELLTMLDDSPKAFRAYPSHCLKNKNDEIYIPFVASSAVMKYVIVSRSFEQCRNMYFAQSLADLPENLSPQNLKHSQKFPPALINNVYVPRQKIFWISVENDNIIIYTYNWAKETIDKLINNCSSLKQWLCIRSCFLSSVTSQKLGLFHNQPLTRKGFMIANNAYSNLMGNIECMSKFPKDPSHHKNINQPSFNLPAVLEAFRDNFWYSKYTCNDIVVVFIIEMKEMKLLEKKSREEMKKLHAMYQSRTSTTTVSQIKLLMQNSRIVHYCHTPLLFLSRWRLKSAATRDHSLFPSAAIQLADKLADEEAELWHTELCYAFFTEYRYYLQTLSFMSLQIDNPQAGVGMWTKDKSSYNSVFYIQKTILGGILIFTVEFCEPFFVTKLHAIECNRLQNISSRASINRFTLSFLDECDRVKLLMHLHSFTYDYHLRCIYNYISDIPGSNKLCERYNVHQFLDDFLKYYNKAPNFARNLVHTDTLTIENLVTEGKQLFDYLLQNVSQYDFKILEIDGEDSEFILVKVTSTPQVSYKDSQDIHHTNDFDITLIVYNLCAPFKPTDNVLHLKYYLILTSKSDIYPTVEIENKLGKFRTVSSTGRSFSALEKSLSDNEATVLAKESSDECVTSSGEHKLVSSLSNKEISGEFSDEINTNQQASSLPYVEIYQESVNYLGYYSSHEQLMQQLILDKAKTTQKDIRKIVEKGMVHCRTNLLWNRLISPQDSNSLSYEEFIELKSLAKLKHLCHLHPNLGPLLNQPIAWYQGLAKLLLVQYVDQNRTFFSADGNVQYYVILDARYFGAFMLLSLDLHTARGELYAVYREPHKKEDAELCLAYQKTLIDGFVNCICFYLWSGMISN